MKGIGVLVLLFLAAPVFLLHSFELEDYPYKSSYDKMFAELKDVNELTNALEDKENDMVYSALKRVGMLRIKSARMRVVSLVALANPDANRGKLRQNADERHIFYLGILVLGRIGESPDGALLSDYLNHTTDTLTQLYIIKALGDLTVSKAALDTLNSYAQKVSQVTDLRIQQQLVDSLRNHHSRSSVTPLIKMQGKVSKEMQVTIGKVVSELMESK